jgi:amino acid permease
MSKEKKQIKESKKIPLSPFKDYWTNLNYIIVFLGLFILIMGYIFMGTGNWDSFLSLVISPVILIISYFLIIPFSIFYKKVKTNKEVDVPSQSKR